MTKLKSKKMNKSTFAIIIMAVIMVAMLAFGGTYAWFTASAATKSNTVTTGYVKLTSGVTFYAEATGIMPGDALITGATVTPTAYGTGEKGDQEYVAVEFIITIKGKDGTYYSSKGVDTNTGATADAPKALPDGFISPITMTGWTETATKGIYVYGTLTDLTEAPTAVPIVVCDDITITATDHWYDGALLSDKGFMEAEVSILMNARSIQAKNIAGDATTVTQLIELFNTYTDPKVGG